MNTLPSGFEPLFRTSPYIELLGPIFNKSIRQGLVLGFFAQEKHCNARGLVHGGVLSGIADIALGYNAVLLSESKIPMVTVRLTIDYAGSIKTGEWVEAHVDVQKTGGRVAFANCYFVVNEKRVARASAVFSVIQKN